MKPIGLKWGKKKPRRANAGAHNLTFDADQAPGAGAVAGAAALDFDIFFAMR